MPAKRANGLLVNSSHKILFKRLSFDHRDVDPHRTQNIEENGGGNGLVWACISRQEIFQNYSTKIFLIYFNVMACFSMLIFPQMSNNDGDITISFL